MPPAGVNVGLVSTTDRISGPLPEALAVAVEQLCRAVTAVDGVSPLDEEATLALRTAHEVPRHHALTLDSAGTALGYAQIDPAAGSISLAVAPDHRRQGLGAALLASAVATLPAGAAPSGWAHGDLPEAARFAARHGFSPVRTLWQMRRSLLGPVPAVRLSPTFRLRAFVPGQDDAAWLDLNARAFSDHPDQGGLTLTDLRARMAEPWFDAEGFLLAQPVAGGPVRDSPAKDTRPAAFHWTKVHDHTEDDPSPAGEVYVLGVDPAWQGHGLGAAMLAAGLERLRDLGLERVLLYVDAANTPAVRLYRSLGFTTWRADVRYARVGSVSS